METLYFKTLIKEDDAPWLVFIHGAGGSIDTWKYQVNAFRDHYNLVLIDLRDHGQSKGLQPDYASYNFDIISNDIIHTLDQLGIQKASFVTLSLGSIILQSIILKRPQMVERCVFAGGVFKGTLRLRAFIHIALFFNRFLSYEQMYRIFSYVLMPRKTHQKARRIYRLQARKLAKEEYLKWLGLYSEFFGLLKSFLKRKVEIPLMVAMGDQDYVFLKAARKFSSMHEKVRLQIIPSSGHICNIDNAGYFNERALEFLQRKD